MLIEFDRVTKRFGQVLANDEVSFSIRSGTIHGLVGENGAGKSTIMKLFYGMYPKDSGTIRVDGKEVEFRSPHEAIAHGIGMVHQHFMLIPTLTVWQNIILGEEDNFWIPFSRVRKNLESRLGNHSSQVPMTAKTEELSVGQKQQVEILKILYRRSSVLILDEPTAVLTPQETHSLFERLLTLRSQGTTIIIITHKIAEVLTLTDSVTVLRQGRVVSSQPTQSLTKDSLSKLIMGQFAAPPIANRQATLGSTVLEIRSASTVSVGAFLDNVSLKVRQGEILGVAGISGNGQEELVDAIAGTQKLSAGEILFNNTPLVESTYRRKRRGIGIIPPDRHRQGLILALSLEENSILGLHNEANFTHRGLLSIKRIRDHCNHLVSQYDIRPQSPELPAEGFSGGNQQKLVVGRELGISPKLIVASYPSRGVDIGATARIHHELIRARNEGAAIILISSELDEILELSDRIAVLFKGRCVATIKRSEATEHTLGQWMMGA